MDKYNFTTKLNLACSTDELRPIMGCVHFECGFAYASNGNIAIKQSLEYHSIIKPELLDGKSLHRDNYANIMQFEVAEATEDGISCRNKDGRTAFFEYFNMDGQPMPDFEKVMGDFRAKPVDFIGINPKYFEILSKALYGGDRIRVSFAGIDRGMICDVLGNDNQTALVMPLILEPTLF